MAISPRGKKKTTFEKLARESRLRERRLEKQARKVARKQAAESQAMPAAESQATPAAEPAPVAERQA